MGLKGDPMDTREQLFQRVQEMNDAQFSVSDVECKLKEQLAERDKEIAQLKERIRVLERPTFGFDDED